MTVSDMLNALSQFDENLPIEILTPHDLVSKVRGEGVWPRFLNGNFGSYRGYYKDMHISYDMHDNGIMLNTVGRLRGILNSALERGIMWGYKGGEFVIDGNTNVWVALDYGNCSNLYVDDIVEMNGTIVVLLGEEQW